MQIYQAQACQRTSATFAPISFTTYDCWNMSRTSGAQFTSSKKNIWKIGKRQAGSMFLILSIEKSLDHSFSVRNSSGIKKKVFFTKYPKKTTKIGYFFNQPISDCHMLFHEQKHRKLRSCLKNYYSGTAGSCAN